MRKSYHIFHASLFGIATIFTLSIFILTRTEQKIEDFSKAKGTIKYLESTYENLPSSLRATGNERYLIIDGIERVFELTYHIDTTSSFSAKINRIDELKVNDTIALYYDDNSYTINENVNHLTQFILKNKVVYYEKGQSGDKVLGFILLGSGFIVLIWLIVLRRTGKIN